jgi:hypothetical protein
MLAENQNKSLGEKLQDLDQMPKGFEFSSDAVWQQLETKLLQQKKKSGFRIQRKYLVAASLLLIISLTAVLMVSKQNRPIQSNLVSKQIPVRINVSSKKTIDVKIQPTKKEVRNYLPTKKNTTVLPVINTNQDLAITEPATIIQSQPISETVATNTIAAVATVVEKKQPIVAKRLPIIHINELSRAPEPMYSKSNNKNIYFNEVEEAPSSNEHPKSWWQPKPKPVNPILSLTDNQ